MANIIIYGGLALLLLGALFGLFVAIKGYRQSGESGLRRITIGSNIPAVKSTPGLKRLIRLWGAVMIAGFLLTGIGLSLAAF